MPTHGVYQVNLTFHSRRMAIRETRLRLTGKLNQSLVFSSLHHTRKCNKKGVARPDTELHMKLMFRVNSKAALVQ